MDQGLDQGTMLVLYLTLNQMRGQQEQATKSGSPMMAASRPWMPGALRHTAGLQAQVEPPCQTWCSPLHHHCVSHYRRQP